MSTKPERCDEHGPGFTADGQSRTEQDRKGGRQGARRAYVSSTAQE